MSDSYKAIVIQDLKVSRKVYSTLPEAIAFIRELFDMCQDRSEITPEFDCVVHGPRGSYSFEAIFPLLCLDDE